MTRGRSKHTVGRGGDVDWFGQVYAEVLDDERLDKNGRAAYVCLVMCADIYSREATELTRAEIAAVMGISVDSFDRGVKQLKAAGYLEVVPMFAGNTRSRAASRYVLYDTKLSRLTRESRDPDAAMHADPVDNLPQVGRAEPPPNGKTPGQGGRRERQPKSGQSGAVAAVSGKGGRCERQPLPQGAAAIPYKRDREREENPSPLPPSFSTAPATADLEGEGEEDSAKIVRAVAETAALRPEWRPTEIRAALVECNDRPWPIVHRAMLECAADPATFAPGRLKKAGPWWARARIAVGHASAPTPLTWCGECNETTRYVEDPDTRDPIGRCPVCHPSRRKQA